METQEIINIALTICGFLGGWILNGLKESIKETQVETKKLADKVSEIEILVAGQYVKADKFDAVVVKLFEKVDKIFDLVQTKADK